MESVKSTESLSNQSQNSSSNKVAFGRRIEGLVVRYLEQKNFKIIARNFYTTLGEADIIAFDTYCKEFALVEVRCKTVKKISKSEMYQLIYTALPKKKLIHLKGLLKYLDIKYKGIRIDFALVVIRRKTSFVRVIYVKDLLRLYA